MPTARPHRFHVMLSDDEHEMLDKLASKDEKAGAHVLRDLLRKGFEASGLTLAKKKRDA